MEEPPPTVDCDTHATNEERSNPQQLAIRGITCFEEKKYTKALRYYRLAYSIEQSPLLTAAIGRSFQELGYPFLAKPYFVNFLNNQKTDADGREKIRARLKNVETALKNSKEVDFKSFPPDATVYLVVDGEHWEEIGTTPVSLSLLTGEYEVVVQREGFVTQTRTISVNEPQEQVFDLIRSDATFNVATRVWRRRGVALILTSVPFLAGGATLFTLGAMRTADAKSTGADVLLRDQLVRDGVALKQWGIIAGAVGITVFTTGVVFYMSGSAPKKKQDSTGWIIGPQSVGYAGTF